MPLEPKRKIWKSQRNILSIFIVFLHPRSFCSKEFETLNPLFNRNCPDRRPGSPHHWPFRYFGEFVFVFTRIWNAFILPRSLDVEGLDLRANKMRAGV